jgi:hypothetical protein
MTNIRGRLFTCNIWGGTTFSLFFKLLLPAFIEKKNLKDLIFFFFLIILLFSTRYLCYDVRHKSTQKTKKIRCWRLSAACGRLVAFVSGMPEMLLTVAINNINLWLCKMICILCILSSMTNIRGRLFTCNIWGGTTFSLFFKLVMSN